jgi:hypothetical protein
VTKTQRRNAIAALSLFLASALACAGRSSTVTVPAATLEERPGVECRTVLEVRPGPYGTASSATPVRRCEPAPAPPPTLGDTSADDEAPLGSPRPPAP